MTPMTLCGKFLHGVGTILFGFRSAVTSAISMRGFLRDRDCSRLFSVSVLLFDAVETQ